ncbi:MAG TPA: tail fiber domain-containing protein [Chthoniobacterales bacterium]
MTNQIEDQTAKTIQRLHFERLDHATEEDRKIQRTNRWQPGLRLLAVAGLLFAGSFLPMIGVKAATNTFYGVGAGTNITGAYDTGFGADALFSATAANFNTAAGIAALYGDTFGSSNTAVGYKALYDNSTGSYNISVGTQALSNNTTGSNNTALGYNALYNSATGTDNTALGQQAGAALKNGSFNINIGINSAQPATESNTIRIGDSATQTNAYMAGIYNTSVNGISVLVDSTGHLGTSVSSARFKEDIRPMGEASRAVLSLQPVSFHYKPELDATHTRQFGLVAEQVAEINPALIARDGEGLPYTVRYEAVNAMLLNEFLQAHRELKAEATENASQTTQLVRLRSIFGEQKKELARLSRQIEKIADQAAVTKPELRQAQNTFLGSGAGAAITTGNYNAGFGDNALLSDTSGSNNTALGCHALSSNLQANGNTAVGRESLALNSGLGAQLNTAVGAHSLNKNTSGQYNTAGGKWGCFGNTTGSWNTALGYQAGYNLTKGTYNIDIGNTAVAGESKTTRIGTCGRQTDAYMAGIYGVVVPNGVQVLIDSTCHLGTLTSSARFKDDIQPMEQASESILGLRPVTYRYKKELDPKGGVQFGLVAEEVAKINRDLVALDDEGQPYTVHYEAVNAMLLNEFLKTQRQLVEQAQSNARQTTAITDARSTLAERQKKIADLAAGAKKINNQLTQTGSGVRTIADETPGITNTFYGTGAGSSITTGVCDSGFGYDALHFNTSGSYATAVGALSLYRETSGSNVAVGSYSLYKATTPVFNTGIGGSTLYNTTTGSRNTAIGRRALYNNQTGSYNIAFGYQAGYNLTTGSYNIDIGSSGVMGEANTIRIGECDTQTNAFMAGIYGVTVVNGVSVVIDSICHLGTNTSSARFKEDIQPIGKVSEAIYSLRPVSFRYKKQFDPRGMPQFGLVAEEVAKINPDLVVNDANGKPLAVRYQAINAMLLNEFLKMHRQVAEEVRENQAQETILNGLRAGLAEQEKTISALHAGLQAIHVKLEVKKSTSRVVAKN